MNEVDSNICPTYVFNGISIGINWARFVCGVQCDSLQSFSADIGQVINLRHSLTTVTSRDSLKITIFVVEIRRGPSTSSFLRAKNGCVFGHIVH